MSVIGRRMGNGEKGELGGEAKEKHRKVNEKYIRNEERERNKIKCDYDSNIFQIYLKKYNTI